MSSDHQRPQLRGYPRAIHSRPVDRQSPLQVLRTLPTTSASYSSEAYHRRLRTSFEQSGGLQSIQEPSVSASRAMRPSVPAHIRNESNTVASTGQKTSGLAEQRFWPPPPGEPRTPPTPRQSTKHGPKRMVIKGERARKDFRVTTPHLSYKTLEEASKILEDRTALQIVGPDDVDAVVASAGSYVLSLLKTFDTEEIRQPPDIGRRSEEEISYFLQWQDESHNKVVERLLLELPHNGAFAEERVWAVLRAVVDMHRYGAANIEVDKLTFKNNLTLKCSDRLREIHEAMRGYTIIRLDVLSRAHIEQLVANPAALVTRKLTNVWVNQKKAAKNKRAKMLAAHQKQQPPGLDGARPD
ncbi:hypothetical protein AMS68_004652 [Peltaster fructicola]|uniref:Uncharacterized protein n=1 Tax=Peltaster fructicola TaxID=286661 RepID=A0A6H0XWU8_9PEZI|nr:hypothetical protein AMS68_004652 [Peltaster fructicola]